jgi:hypothetical protein
MKLIALRDRWRASSADANSPEVREFERQQAQKHAQDACRTVAMLTREENSVLGDVLTALRGTSVFTDPVEAFSTLYGDDTGWGLLVAANHWQPDPMICNDFARRWQVGKAIRRPDCFQGSTRLTMRRGHPGCG